MSPLRHQGLLFQPIMKRLLMFMLFARPAIACAHGLLNFGGEPAFDRATVNAIAEPNYRARIQRLAADGLLDIDPTLFLRLRAQVYELKHAARFERPDIALIAWEIYTCRYCN